MRYDDRIGAWQRLDIVDATLMGEIRGRETMGAGTVESRDHAGAVRERAQGVLVRVTASVFVS